MAAPDRRSILESNDLAAAPRWRQTLFWQTYNRSRRWTRNTAALGEVAEELISVPGLRSARRLRWIEQAWKEVVPAPYGARTSIDGFSRGKLVIGVDSAVTKFYLSRQAGGDLLGQLNAYLGEPAVNRVEYRVRPPAGEGAPVRREGVSKRGGRA